MKDTEPLPLIAVLMNCTGSKINDFQSVVEILIDEHVFRFDVSVYNVFFMEICYGMKNLLNNLCSCFLRKGSNFNDFVKEFTSLAKLGDKIKSLIVLEYLIKLQNVWVIQLLEDSNLFLKALQLFSVHRLFSD